MLSTEPLKTKPERTSIIEPLLESRPPSSRSPSSRSLLLGQNPQILEARILIVDDQLANITLYLVEILFVAWKNNSWPSTKASLDQSTKMRYGW